MKIDKYIMCQHNVMSSSIEWGVFDQAKCHFDLQLQRLDHWGEISLKSHYFAGVEYPTSFIMKINSSLAFFCFVGFGRLLSSQAGQGR